MKRLVVLAAVVGCTREQEQAAVQVTAPKVAPMRVAFGACADAKSWVSGPRPMAFTAADLGRAWAPRAPDDQGRDPGQPEDAFLAAFASRYAQKERPEIAWRLDLRGAEGPLTESHVRAMGGYWRSVDACLHTLAANARGTIALDVAIAKPGEARIAASGAAGKAGACIAKVFTEFFASFREDDDQGHLAMEIAFWPGAEPPLDEGSQMRGLFRLPREVSGDPAIANPLRARVGDLARCLQGQVGAATIEPSGVVHGLAAPAATCVAAIAKQVGLPGTCGIAFGVQPLEQLAAIEIGEKAYRFAGADAVNLFQLGELLASRAPIVGGAEPLVVKPPVLFAPRDDNWADMVIGVLEYLEQTGDDVVLARRRNGALVPVGRVALPAPPVPLGTGGHWMPFVPTGARPSPDRRSLLVGKHRVWLNERAAPRDGLDELLRGARAAAPDDLLEIGAVHITWSELLGAIDAAEAAGFTRWHLVEHRQLDVPDQE